jgi:hypothetical protein
MFHRDQTVLALAVAIAAGMPRFPSCRRPGPGTAGQTAGRRETARSSGRRPRSDIARPIRELGGLYRVARRQEGLFHFREAG